MDDQQSEDSADSSDEDEKKKMHENGEDIVLNEIGDEEESEAENKFH